MPYTPWVEEGLKERVIARAAELGKTLTQVLGEAGLAHDTLDKAFRGRRTDTYEKLARALDWSIVQVMGLEPTSSAWLNGPMLHAAMMMASRVLRRFGKVPDAMLYEEAASILNVQIAQLLDRGDPLNRDFLQGIERRLLEELRRQQHTTSAGMKAPAD